MTKKDMTGQPWISVILPVYNVEKYLERCLNSILAQTFSDFEVILVDDGSTDSSGSICDEYALKYPNIIAIHKENGGLASARNTGIPHACGEYVAFVDSDDWIEKTTYQVLHSSVLEYAPDIISFGCRKIQNGTVLNQTLPEFPEGLYSKEQLRNQILPDSIAKHRAFDQAYLPVHMSAWGNLYKRDFVQKKALLFTSEREVLNEDWLFNIRCLHRAESLQVIHKAFYNYDTREGSLSMSHKSDSYERKKKLFAAYQEELADVSNSDPEINLRLRNFWLEAIYNCYAIEMMVSDWDSAVKQRIKKMLHDPDFIAFSKKMKPSDCTLKGYVFILLTRLQLHGLLRLAYRLKKKYWR